MDGLRSYAFISVFVAHAADGRLESDELAVIRRNVRRAAAALGHTLDGADAIVDEAVGRYWEGLAETGAAAMLRRFENEARALQRRIPPGALRTIQADLTAVANADGHSDDMERWLIEHVAAEWRSMHH
jgi:uncharacterized membrane protein YebE (DUF533 family)